MINMNWIKVTERKPETNLGKNYKHSEIVAVKTKEYNYPTTARLEVYKNEEQWFCLLSDDFVTVLEWCELPK